MILDVAREAGLDVTHLDDALRAGRARRAVFEDFELARGDDVAMNPHLFLPDGTSVTNPGMTVHWQGEWARGFPVIDADDPSIYDGLVKTAAANARG